MKDRDPASYPLAVIGAKEPLLDWTRIDWQTVKKRVKNLRQRIYRATRNGQTFTGGRRLEPDEGKLSFPVLRGEGRGDVSPLTRR